MARAFLLSVLVYAAWAIPAAAAPATAHPTTLEMTPGMIVFYKVAVNFKEVVIGRHEVVDAVVITDRSLTLNAKDPGRTTILLFSPENELVDSLEIDVVPLERGVGRKTLSVRSFEREYTTRTYYCAGSGPCIFDKAAISRPQLPTSSTGRTVTADPVAEKSQ